MWRNLLCMFSMRIFDELQSISYELLFAILGPELYNNILCSYKVWFICFFPAMLACLQCDYCMFFLSLKGKLSMFRLYVDSC